jgi:creatinine amidohydrolase
MRTMIAAFGALALAAAARSPQTAKPTGVALADLSWQEAEPVLTASAVVLIPLGAGSLEFGPHMKLSAGERLARYLASRIQAATSVVVAPPLSYHFYPAYSEYSGSTSLERATARDVTVEVVRSLAQPGPRRFYVLNTGGPSIGPLSEAAKALADQGILLGYTDMRYQLQSAQITRQQRDVSGAPHADEIETSMLLFADPSAVDMTKAVSEYGTGRGALTRKEGGTGIFSKTGVLGDATVATAEKGRVLIDRLVSGVLDDIDKLRSAPLPVAKPTTPAAPAPPPARAARPAEIRMANGCTPSDEREIRQIGQMFGSVWQEMDALKISQLFTLGADIRHPDGTIERTRDLIRQNREQLFQKREYRGSIHPVTIADIRCLDGTYAIADGRWELRYADVSDANRARGTLPTAQRPTFQGLCTLIVSKSMGPWLIEAWRYTVNPSEGTPPPSILKQPGFIGRGH